MEELIKWIIENKELVILACITVSVSIPISIHFGKTIVNNNIKKNNTTNNYNNYHNKTNQNTKNTKPKNTPHSTATYNNPVNNVNVELNSIRLYSTGKKGKVYTNKFYKSMNHNFGIEITLKNNTSSLKNVKVGWCIYKDNIEIIKGTFNKKVNANSSLTTDFYVKEQTFNSMKVGEYKSQFWVNDKKVQKVFFKIYNK